MIRKVQPRGPLHRRPRDDLKSIATQVLSGARGLDAQTLRPLADQLKHMIEQGHATEPHRLHGERTSNLFAHIAASLGEAVLVKEEDAGEVFSRDPLQPPDWRVVLRDERQFLVEVKNCHDDPGGRFSLRTHDLDALEAYAATVAVPLRIAIYWSKIRQWALIPPGAFTVSGDGAAWRGFH